MPRGDPLPQGFLTWASGVSVGASGLWDPLDIAYNVLGGQDTGPSSAPASQTDSTVLSPSPRWPQPLQCPQAGRLPSSAPCRAPGHRDKVLFFHPQVQAGCGRWQVLTECLGCCHGQGQAAPDSTEDKGHVSGRPHPGSLPHVIVGPSAPCHPAWSGQPPDSGPHGLAGLM